MALAKTCHNQFYKNQILMQPIKMTTQHAPRRAYLFSFGGQKLVAQAIFRFLKWAFATEYSFFRKLAPLLGTFHPQKMTGLHMGVAGIESACHLPPLTCLHL
jgi:hypothetical protein